MWSEMANVWSACLQKCAKQLISWLNVARCKQNWQRMNCWLDRRMWKSFRTFVTMSIKLSWARAKQVIPQPTTRMTTATTSAICPRFQCAGSLASSTQTPTCPNLWRTSPITKTSNCHPRPWSINLELQYKHQQWWSKLLSILKLGRVFHVCTKKTSNLKNLGLVNPKGSR